jgi:molecular chaperone DnaK
VTRVTGWNDVLIRLAVAEPDPLRRFRVLHRSGKYAQALEALAAETAPLADPADLHRQLHCLAEVGDADRYREVLLSHTRELSVEVVDPQGPQRLLVRARPALVRIMVAHSDGCHTTGTGFLVSTRLVATNQHWVAERSGGQRTAIDVDQIRVAFKTGIETVERIFLPDYTYTDVALLELAESAAATPLRLGYARLARVGDRVWATSTADEQDLLLAGVIDKFESFSEQRLRVFRTSLQLPVQTSGGPLFNDLGEVIGILSVNEQTAMEGAFALTVDTLDPLLTSAGFNRLKNC